VKATAVDRAKLSAILGPMLLVVTVPLLALASISGHAAFVAGLCAAGASTSTALLNFWHPMPGSRRGMLRRHAQSKLVGLVEHALAMLWAITALFAIIGSWITVGPLAVALVILGICRARHRRTSSTANKPSVNRSTDASATSNADFSPDFTKKSPTPATMR
jgi:ABC-2 type transport system permease protein